MCRICEERKERLRMIRNNSIRRWLVGLAGLLTVVIPVTAIAMIVRGPSARPSKAFKISIEVGEIKVQSLAPKTTEVSPPFNVSDSLDPILNPSNADRIFRVASHETGWRWAGDLVGIHIRETNGVLYGDVDRAGGANVREQLEIQDRWGKPENLLAFNDLKHRIELGLLKVPWDPDKIQGSRGTSTLKKNTRNFGGCVGPMQVSWYEWMTDDNGFYADKDPLNMYWSVRHTASRLQKVYVSRLKALKKARSGRIPSNPKLARVIERQMEEGARNYAIRQYRGNESSDLAYDYQDSVRRTSAYYELNPHMVEMRVRRTGKLTMYASADLADTVR